MRPSIRRMGRDVFQRLLPKHGWAWKQLQSGYLRTKLLCRQLSRNSIFVEEEELPMCSLRHPRKLELALQMFRPGTALDLGCGTGWSLDYMLERGIDAWGVEGSRLAISCAKHPERIIRHNLSRPLALRRTSDMIWCIEFVEHIHPRFVDNLMEVFSAHSDLVVMSAAPPGQGGEGHFNEQLPSYWIDKFVAKGYRLEENATGKLQRIEEQFSRNMLVFFRADATLRGMR